MDPAVISGKCADKLKSLAGSLGLDYEERLSESGRAIASLSDEGHFYPGLVYIQTES